MELAVLQGVCCINKGLKQGVGKKPQNREVE